jgi:hypothetical protein
LVVLTPDTVIFSAGGAGCFGAISLVCRHNDFLSPERRELRRGRLEDVREGLGPSRIVGEGRASD